MKGKVENIREKDLRTERQKMRKEIDIQRQINRRKLGRQIDGQIHRKTDKNQT